jgi:seryl-tRNA synthetase
VRVYAALLETYRLQDGDVEVPQVLVDYVGAKRISAVG